MDPKFRKPLWTRDYNHSFSSTKAVWSEFAYKWLNHADFGCRIIAHRYLSHRYLFLTCLMRILCKYSKNYQTLYLPHPIHLFPTRAETHHPSTELFSRILGMRTLWGRTQGFCRIWNGTTPYVLISKPSAVEVSPSFSLYILLTKTTLLFMI